MKTNELRTPLTASAAIYALVFLFATPVYSQTPFYQGKTITIIQGRDPGGTGDMRVRAMIPFLQKSFRETLISSASICPVEEVERPRITSTGLLALTA